MSAEIKIWPFLLAASLRFLSHILSLRQSSTRKIVQIHFNVSAQLIYLYSLYVELCGVHCINVIYQVKWWMLNKCARCLSIYSESCARERKRKREKNGCQHFKMKNKFVELFIVKRLVLACVCHFNEFHEMNNLIAALWTTTTATTAKKCAFCSLYIQRA